MKNLFTFIVALFMATGVYAQDKQTYKSFTETTVWFPNQTEVQTAINEGWASVRKVTEKNFPSKTGNILAGSGTPNPKLSDETIDDKIEVLARPSNGSLWD